MGITLLKIDTFRLWRFSLTRQSTSSCWQWAYWRPQLAVAEHSVTSRRLAAGHSLTSLIINYCISLITCAVWSCGKRTTELVFTRLVTRDGSHASLFRAILSTLWPDRRICHSRSGKQPPENSHRSVWAFFYIIIFFRSLAQSRSL